MQSCPAIHLHTYSFRQRVYLPYFPTFQTITPLKKKRIKNSQNSASFLCVTDSFYRWAFQISKNSRDPWGMRNRKMQCHLQHGWLQRNRSFERGRAINRMFALRQPSQMLWSTVPRESKHPQGQFHRVSSFWEYEGWCVRTNILWAYLHELFPDASSPPLLQPSTSGPLQLICSISQATSSASSPCLRQQETSCRNEPKAGARTYYSSVHLPSVLAGINFRTLHLALLQKRNIKL